MNLPKVTPRHMHARLRKVLTAHAAIEAGIATHAQKATEERLANLKKLEADKKLHAITGGSNATP